MHEKTKTRLRLELIQFLENFQAGKNKAITRFRFGDLEIWTKAKRWNSGLSYFFAHQSNSVDNRPVETVLKDKDRNPIKTIMPHWFYLYDVDSCPSDMTLVQRLREGMMKDILAMEEELKCRHRFMRKMGFEIFCKYQDYIIQLNGPWYCEARFYRDEDDEFQLALIFNGYSGTRSSSDDSYSLTVPGGFKKPGLVEDEFFKSLGCAVKYYGGDFLAALPENWRIGLVEVKK